VVLPESDSHPSNNQNEKQNLAITPKTFVAEEMIDEQKVTLLQTSFFFLIFSTNS
jgi:hypothetical protein